MNYYYLLLISFITLGFFSGCKRSVSSSDLNQEMSHPGKKIKDMDLTEALYAYNYYKERKQSESAIKALERCITLSESHLQTEKLVLDLADLLLANGNFEKSQKVYKEFKNFYPGSSSLEYALYQEIVSHHLASLSPDRDQTATKETVTLSTAFLNRFGNQSEYSSSVEGTLKQAYRTLWQHELNQVEFYLNKFSYLPQKSALIAARQRLQHIRSDILPHITDIDSVVLAQLETRIQIALNQSSDLLETEKPAPEQLNNQVKEFTMVVASMNNIIGSYKTSQKSIHPRDRF